MFRKQKHYTTTENPWCVHMFAYCCEEHNTILFTHDSKCNYDFTCVLNKIDVCLKIHRHTFLKIYQICVLVKKVLLKKIILLQLIVYYMN